MAVFNIFSIPNSIEEKTQRGRIDNAVVAGTHLWIFELKVDGSAAEALKQIDEKGYAERFSYLRSHGITIHKVGFSISSKTRKITDWRTV